jgi:hypothetical protein
MQHAGREAAQASAGRPRVLARAAGAVDRLNPMVQGCHLAMRPFTDGATRGNGSSSTVEPEAALE